MLTLRRYRTAMKILALNGRCVYRSGCNKKKISGMSQTKRMMVSNDLGGGKRMGVAPAGVVDAVEAAAGLTEVDGLEDIGSKGLLGGKSFDEDPEDRKGYKFDEVLDIQNLINSQIPGIVINENRNRPRKFIKMGKNTIEEPGGESEAPGSLNPSPETREMGRKIMAFFKGRESLPTPTHKAPFRPGKRGPKMIMEASAFDKQTSKYQPGSTGKGNINEEMMNNDKRMVGTKISKLKLLSKKQIKSMKRQPPPKANIRQTFRPQVPRGYQKQAT